MSTVTHISLLTHSQDACGIVTCGQKGRLNQCKGNGLVRDLLDANNLNQLNGGMGVGHGEDDFCACLRA